MATSFPTRLHRLRVRSVCSLLASLGDGVSLFEPSAGSAPDIAGQGIANPLAQILSVAMMLIYAFDMTKEAAWIEAAVERVLDEGWRTRDIADSDTPAEKIIVVPPIWAARWLRPWRRLEARMLGTPHVRSGKRSALRLGILH